MLISFLLRVTLCHFLITTIFFLESFATRQIFCVFAEDSLSKVVYM